MLRITNLGFGDPVPVFRGGAYAPQRVAGAEPRRPGVAGNKACLRLGLGCLGLGFRA